MVDTSFMPTSKQDLAFEPVKLLLAELLQLMLLTTVLMFTEEISFRSQAMSFVSLRFSRSISLSSQISLDVLLVLNTEQFRLEYLYLEKDTFKTSVANKNLKVIFIWQPEVADNYSCIFFLFIYNLFININYFKKVI